MNWLAHLRLAPEEPLVRIGNLAGDFVQGVDLTTLHPEVRRGIVQHRAIDRFVDAHEATLRARSRMAAPFRRFAPVLIDVFFDHYLARDWERLGGGDPLPDFAATVHGELREHTQHLPPRLRDVVPWMESQRWLTSYAETTGIDAILVRMSRRLSRPSPLAEGGTQLRERYDDLAADFATLWPELVTFARSLHERAP